MSPYLPLVFVIISAIGGFCQQQQIVEIFSEPNCQGNSPTPVESTSSPILSPDVTYVSFRTTGLWRVHPCNTTTNCNPTLPLTFGHTPVCNALTFLQGMRVSFTRFGDGNQVEKRITFYSSSDLQGAGRGFDTDTPDANAQYNSFFHTGHHNWTLYDGPGYTGSSICVTPHPDVLARGFGVSYTINTPGTLGSIREGCGAISTTTNTPIPTTTMATTSQATTTQATTTQATTTQATTTLATTTLATTSIASTTTQPTTPSTNITQSTAPTTNGTRPSTVPTNTTTPATIRTTPPVTLGPSPTPTPTRMTELTTPVPTRPTVDTNATTTEMSTTPSSADTLISLPLAMVILLSHQLFYCV